MWSCRYNIILFLLAVSYIIDPYSYRLSRCKRLIFFVNGLNPPCVQKQYPICVRTTIARGSQQNTQLNFFHGSHVVGVVHDTRVNYVPLLITQSSSGYAKYDNSDADGFIMLPDAALVLRSNTSSLIFYSFAMCLSHARSHCFTFK